MAKELPELTKRYYSIGEVADLFEVNTSLIRYWEKEFPSLEPKKNKKGNRMFTPQDIETLQIIYHLVKERGFTIDGAKNKMRLNKSESVPVDEVILKLQNIREQLQKLKNAM